MKVRNKKTGDIYTVRNTNAKMLVYGEVVEGFVTLSGNGEFIVTRKEFADDYEEYRRHIPNYGDVMTLDEFWKDLESGCICDDDGSGDWVDENDCIIESDLDVMWLRKENGEWENRPEDAVKVIWYNN